MLHDILIFDPEQRISDDAFKKYMRMLMIFEESILMHNYVGKRPFLSFFPDYVMRSFQRWKFAWVHAQLYQECGGDEHRHFSQAWLSFNNMHSDQSERMQRTMDSEDAELDELDSFPDGFEV
jgi:hypothetical protein